MKLRVSPRWSSFGLHPRMQGPGNNANNIRMGVPNMMMGMGQGGTSRQIGCD